MTTLPPFGPSVTLTALASWSTPRSRARRASSLKLRVLDTGSFFYWDERQQTPRSPVGGRGVCSVSRVVDQASMTARTSRAERTRYSSPAYFTSVPPYLL